MGGRDWELGLRLGRMNRRGDVQPIAKDDGADDEVVSRPMHHIGLKPLQEEVGIGHTGQLELARVAELLP